MSINDTVRLAFSPFRTRKLESLLIVLGVALGVAVVTSMLALILTGIQQTQNYSESLGAREITITTKSTDYRGFYVGGTVNPLVNIGRATDKPVILQQTDLEDLKRESSVVEFAYLSDFSSIAEFTSDTKKFNPGNEIEVRAVTESYIQAANLKLLSGTWFSKEDFLKANRAVVVSDYFAKLRFKGKAAVGQEIRSQQGSPYKIIGVFATPKDDWEFASEKTGNAFGARGLVPWGINDIMTLQVRELKFLAAKGQSNTALEQLQRAVEKRWGGRVSVTSQSEQFKTNAGSTISAAVVTALFACGGLVIAAINITNLMLARVLGRTRNIGISGALGASRSMVFRMFLAESLALGLIGGLLGLFFAWGLTAGLQAAFKASSQISGSGFTLGLQPIHLVLGLLVGIGISVLFGIYPAITASRIRPSEALRA
jgi:putative ABC transport system permease protein